MAQHYERLGTVEVATALAVIAARLNHERHPETAPAAPAAWKVLGQRIWVAGVRLQTFANGHALCCAHPECGLAITHAVIERAVGRKGERLPGQRFHLNFYGTNGYGHEVLFTHDHTLARSLGGPDDLSNTLPMCLRCNARKSKAEHALLRARRLEAGLNPHTGGPLLGWTDPSEHRGLQKTLAAFALQAERRGLTEEAYRTFCEHEQGGGGHPQPPFISTHDRRAALLGLTRGGYSAFRRDRNAGNLWGRLQVALGTPPHALPALAGCV